MKRVFFIIAFLAVSFGVIGTALPHTPGVYLTWNKEISRVFYARCAECHRNGGSSFSLMTFPEVQPRLAEIQNAVLNRRMPPWGAVKGFGEFRNDQGLTQEEIELVSDWINGDARRGNNPDLLPPVPKFTKTTPFVKPKIALEANGADGDLKLPSPFVLDGLLPQTVPDDASMRVVATFPDGHVEPLLWLYQYKDSFRHPFFLRTPMELPAGTVIQGIPSGSSVVLLPGKKAVVKPKA